MTPDIFAETLKAVPIGFATGILSGCFGVGGGIISTPVLHMVLGMSAHSAVGTTLAVIIPTAVAGMRNYSKQNLVYFKLGIYCGIPSVLGTVFGSFATKYLEGRLLMLMLATLMAVVGGDFITGFSHKLRKAGEDVQHMPDLSGKDKVGAGFLGVAVGLLSGLLGVGGGFIMVPCFCYFFRMPIKMAFGTSLLVISAVSIPGTLVHALHGHVDFPIAAAMLVGSVPGAWIGSKLALGASDKTLKIAFGVVLVILAAIFAYQELHT